MKIGALVQRMLAHRASFPRWVNRAIDWPVDHPPQFLWNALSPFAQQVEPQEIPPAPIVPAQTTERIIIGPLNYSAQGYQWARALERQRPNSWVHNFSLEVPGGFDFPTDAQVPMHVHASSTQWQKAQFEAVRQATHVLIEAERPLFGRYFSNFEAEAHALLQEGLSVAAIAHGTDVRVPSEHARTTPWSVYREKDFYAGREETLARRNRDALRRLGIPIFVSTPDLLTFLPEAHWCPVVVDLSAWDVGNTRNRHSRLVVSHAPSVARVKGTDLVEPVLLRLHEEGVIEYRPARGIKAAEMPAFYADTDIVLDQFRLGSYGVAACEAMCAGRVVLGHVTDTVRSVIRDRTGNELPIVETTPDTVGQVLQDFAEHPQRLREIATSGQAFVGAVHDGRLSAHIFGEHWLDASHRNAGESR